MFLFIQLINQSLKLINENLEVNMNDKDDLLLVRRSERRSLGIEKSMSWDGQLRLS